MACGGDNTMRRIRPDGSMSVFVTRTEPLKTNPLGMAFDNAGDLFVTDNGGNNGTTVSRNTVHGYVRRLQEPSAGAGAAVSAGACSSLWRTRRALLKTTRIEPALWSNAATIGPR